MYIYKIHNQLSIKNNLLLFKNSSILIPLTLTIMNISVYKCIGTYTDFNNKLLRKLVSDFHITSILCFV